MFWPMEIVKGIRLVCVCGGGHAFAVYIVKYVHSSLHQSVFPIKAAFSSAPGFKLQRRGRDSREDGQKPWEKKQSQLPEAGSSPAHICPFSHGAWKRTSLLDLIEGDMLSTKFAK